MTAEAISHFPRELVAVLPRLPKPVEKAYAILTPKQGWLGALLLLGVLLTVTVTIAKAEWTEAPGIIQLTAYSFIAGLLLAKVRTKWLPWPLLILVGLFFGLTSIWWQASRLVIQEPLPEQFRLVGVRLYDWYIAASTGGISTDLLPFAMGLLTGTWLLGFLSSWALFRRSIFWVVVVLGGIALFTHVSFLPEELSLSFFMFMFFAVLLIARMSFLQRQQEWQQAEIETPPKTGWFSMNWALSLAAAILIIAAVLPGALYVSRTVSRAWTAGRTPVENLEGGFTRLVTGVDSKKNLPGRLFGDTLPFLGEINFNGEVVFWADTEYASYWLSRTYSEYTAKGWIAGDTIDFEVGPETVFPSTTDSLKRSAVPQRLQVMFKTEGLLAGGNLEWLSREAVIETLAPKEFKVNLLDAGDDHEFPADIQLVAETLREELNTPSVSFVESTIGSLLPNDLVITSIEFVPDEKVEPIVRAITLQRKDPISPEVVSFYFKDDLLKDETYAMVSLVSTATDDDLRLANTNYSSTMRDHYLQLPSSLPQRVRDLAIALTRNADTPLDKARAVETYLRSSEFTYSQDIDKPPDGTDGVDHFLFESKTGYSDYFASAMTVLMRAVGVPARMAAGYAPGEVSPELGLLAVRDTDSHGWTQVYFPGYGWVDFEPTPNWPEHQRVMGLPNAGIPGALGVGQTVQTEDAGQLDRFLFPAEISNIGLGSSGLGGTRPGLSLTRIFTIVGGLLGGIILLLGLSRLVWHLMIAGLTPVERVYASMGRLGRLAGVMRSPSTTPQEFATAITAAVPRVASDASLVASQFSVSRYGGREPSEEDQHRLQSAWRSVRRALLKRILRRLMPLRASATA
ncbi:MAG: DUF4129 domain-containing protein [Chloroflexi bacterium]|nr:DUF4129 domain-containing protein [Chloroflexota bacterium]